MMTKTFALIVTYGDHKEQLARVLHKTLENNIIDHVFIIDNGSNYDLVKEIKEVSDDKVSLKLLRKNTGSAGGFGRGIKEAVKYSNNNLDRLLILDDDSYAELDALDKIDLYEQKMGKDRETVWSLSRLHTGENPLPFDGNFDYAPEYYYNSFYRFSITNKLMRKRYQIKRKDKRIRHLAMAPYSGLLIKLSVIHKVGFPLEEMYLYSDDIEYTFRISNSGIDILQMFDANIRDIAGSWFDSKKTNVHNAFFQEENYNYRALYGYRNEAYLSKNVFLNSKILSGVNYFMWNINLIIKRMPKNKRGIQHYKILRKVVKQGFSGKLGKKLDI